MSIAGLGTDTYICLRKLTVDYLCFKVPYTIDPIQLEAPKSPKESHDTQAINNNFDLDGK